MLASDFGAASVDSLARAPIFIGQRVKKMQFLKFLMESPFFACATGHGQAIALDFFLGCKVEAEAIKFLSDFACWRRFNTGITMTDSQELLVEYVETGSEPAFRELVTRFLNLVYSAAVRLTEGDTHRAEDIAQTVFADLARMARTLSGEVMLGGWLHRHTCHVAATILRSERRRQFRERQAVEMNALHDHSETNLAQVVPILDEVINQLGAADRTAILLRFFEQRDFRTIGQALGTNEDAAQKRVTRALEKMHSLLEHRGIAFSAAALGTALSAQAVVAAPAGLAVSIASAALASAAVTGGTALTLLRIVTMTKLKLGIISAIVVAVVATPMVIQYQAQVRLRAENAILRQQTDEKAQLAAENRLLSNQLTELKASRPLADQQLSELMRLRGEIGMLRNQRRQVAQSQQTNASSSKSDTQVHRVRMRELSAADHHGLEAPTVPLLPAGSWANVGTATPEACFQTLQWALANKDINAFAQTVAWDPDVKVRAQALFDAAPESLRQKFGSIDGVLDAVMTATSPESQPMKGFGVVSQDITGDDGTLTAQLQYADGKVSQDPIPVHRFDDGWRLILPPQTLDEFSQFLNTPAVQAKESKGKQ